MLEHLLSCSADVRGHRNAKKTSNNNATGSSSRSSGRNSQKEDDDSSCNSSMLDRKPSAKRSSELSEDTGEGDAAAAGLLALKSFPGNGSISSSALSSSRRTTTGAAASATASFPKKGEPEDKEEDAHQRSSPETQQHDLRNTSVDSRYECPCCQHEFFTTQTSWEEIQLHVTSCVDLNESIDSANIMASALVTMKSSPEIPNDLRASRKRKLAPKAAAAAAAAAEAVSADNRVEGKKRAPKQVASNSKAVKSSKTYSTRKKKPPRPSKRRDRGGSIAAAASEKKRRAQDIASLSSGPMQQMLRVMVMGHLDMLH